MKSVCLILILKRWWSMGEKHSQGNILPPPLDNSIKLAIECKYGDTIRAGNVFFKFSWQRRCSSPSAVYVQCSFTNCFIMTISILRVQNFKYICLRARKVKYVKKYFVNICKTYYLLLTCGYSKSDLNSRRDFIYLNMWNNYPPKKYKLQTRQFTFNGWKWGFKGVVIIQWKWNQYNNVNL